MNELKVAAVINNRGFDSSISLLSIEKNGIKLELTNEDWKEINSTLKGQRRKVAQHEEGEYTPKLVVVWNRD